MKPKIFHAAGWIFLLMMAILWLTAGYSYWVMVLLPAAVISFSIADGSIKELAILKKLSGVDILSIMLAFVAAVAVVYLLIQLGNYLIRHVFHLHGIWETISIFIVIILSLYPVKLVLAKFVLQISRAKERT